MSRLTFIIIFLFTVLTGCKTSRVKSDNADNSPLRIKFLNYKIIPYHSQLDQTFIGGLSDIDYNSEKDEYYLICDDRSEINPSRFYTAKITLADTGITDIHFTKMTFLHRPDGQLYPNHLLHPDAAADPEALRLNRRNHLFYWSSEGERIVNKKDTILQNPSINIIDSNGYWQDSLPLPTKFQMSFLQKGPRRNSVFEGIAFSEDYRYLTASMEEPLYEDGHASDTVEHPNYCRFIQWKLGKTNEETAEYAYHTDAVTQKPVPANGSFNNGISSIFAWNKNVFLVVERAYAAGNQSTDIRLYAADFSQATDVKDIPSLSEGHHFLPASKRLVFNFNTLGFPIDNIEGLCIGPRLPNGHRTLLLMVDDNFNKRERMQCLSFEILE